MKKWQKKAIREIMEEFDFEKVHKVMLILNWWWADTGKPPTVGELRERAEELLTHTAEVITGQYGFYSTIGGLEVYSNSVDKIIKLSFIAAEWEASK